jgi:hypothetical protein
MLHYLSGIIKIHISVQITPGFTGLKKNGEKRRQLPCLTYWLSTKKMYIAPVKGCKGGFLYSK